MARRTLWTGEPPGTNPFALPRGLRGRAAGWVLARSNRAQNREVAGFLRVSGGETVLEVGHGPGTLIELLTRCPDVSVVGVDPSTEMVRMARRRNAGAVRAGRVHVHQGHAHATGLADACVDVVVSVNTVAMWPLLDDAVSELHRVIRPGGHLVVTWHRQPERFTLTPEELSTVEKAVQNRFGAAARSLLPSSVVFHAWR